MGLLGPRWPAVLVLAVAALACLFVAVYVIDEEKNASFALYVAGLALGSLSGYLRTKR